MTAFPDNTDTICAPATAQGGAIAILRISGPKAIEAADAIFSRNIRDAHGYTLHYGSIDSLDDVMVSVFRAPRSYTGEDAVEIACHGSAYIVQQIMDRLVEQGCRAARPGEFTQRAFLNGRMDLSQAEAVADLIAATNAASHRLAMSQMKGGITRELQEMREQLLRLTSLLELELDFSDHEDLEFADRSELSALTAQLTERIGRLADSFRAGRAIKEGIPVAIIGAPNVGKSTLLNLLLQDDRAIVSDIQGTTRDVIEDTAVIGGYNFRFIDTAGLRHTDDRIERLGIERSLMAIERAQIVLLLSAPGADFPDLADQMQTTQATLIPILAKADLLEAANDDGTPAESSAETNTIANTSETAIVMAKTIAPAAGTDDDLLCISAKTGFGIDALLNRLAEEAQRLTMTDSDLVVTNARHHAALSAARESLHRVAQALADGLSGDLIALDLREALFHLAEITGGEITSDEVLGNIFAHFCIGK